MITIIQIRIGKKKKERKILKSANLFVSLKDQAFSLMPVRTERSSLKMLQPGDQFVMRWESLLYQRMAFETMHP